MFPPKVNNILMEWLNRNLDHPYPLDKERQKLCEMTGLSRKQLRGWLTDARRVSLYSFITSKA